MHLPARGRSTWPGGPRADLTSEGDPQDAGAFPEVSFRSELLAWVPAGWRAVGRLQVKDTEHELACRFDLRLDELQPGGPPRVGVAGSWVVDSRWVTRQRIPGLGRRIVMTCSLSLEPDM